MNNNKVIYLHSKRDIAGIVCDLTVGLKEAQSDNEAWWKDNSVLVYSTALGIWLDRLNNYPAYERSIIEEAAQVGALLRVGE